MAVMLKCFSFIIRKAGFHLIKRRIHVVFIFWFTAMVYMPDFETLFLGGFLFYD